MALNFPDSPTLGQVYTDTTSGFSYEWDGTVWKSYSAASVSNIKVIDDISSGFNSSTTTFALTSGGLAVTPYSDQQLIVNLGGVIQDSVSDYHVVGSNIIFTTPPAAGLTFSATLLGTGVSIDYANNGNVYERQTYTATAGQTSFTFTAGYTPGYFDVYRNGVRLSSGSDFTATSGTGFTLTIPAQLNDEIEAIGYKVKSIVTSQGDVVNLNVTGIATISPSTFINNTGINVAGIVTATSFSGDGSGLTGVGVGIQSAGNVVGYGITTLNFAGAGNTFSVSGSTATITISGSGSGVSSTGVSTAAIWSNPSFITTSYVLNQGNNNYGVFGPITVSVGATITVGAGNTFVVV